VVLLVVVLWVWANVEATAKLKQAIVTVSMIDVFISDKSLGSISCEPTNKNRYAPWSRM
jgi:hypothetical protein